MGMISIGCGAAARGVPVFLPFTEGTADASTFVCEFTGGAGASETGAGGGLTGADLVLTASGSPVAASGGWRPIDAVDDGFSVTQALTDALLNGPEYTIAVKVRNWGNSEKTLAVFQSGTGPFKRISITQCLNAVTPNRTLHGTSFGLPHDYNYGGRDGLVCADTLPASSAYWVALWRKSGALHLGFTTNDAMPTGWDSFLPAQRRVGYGFGDTSGLAIDTTRALFSACGLEANRIVISKVGLQAAPL